MDYKSQLSVMELSKVQRLSDLSCLSVLRFYVHVCMCAMSVAVIPLRLVGMS